MRSGRGGIPMMDLGPTAWGLDFAPTRRARTENPASTQWMEARGIEPRSRDVSMRASTCIVRSFSLRGASRRRGLGRTQCFIGISGKSPDS
jgi:hypothetical protein